MKNTIDNRNEIRIEIPAGCFEGNCSSCQYANYHDKDSQGRVWCDSFNRYNFSSDRNGCFRYVRED